MPGRAPALRHGAVGGVQRRRVRDREHASSLEISVPADPMTAIGAVRRAPTGFVREGVTKEEVEAATSRTTPNLAFYGLVLVLAIVAPQVAVASES